MIPVRFREALPPYWYENEVAGWHFGVMEEEINLREQKMNDLVDQFILKRATWGIGIKEWVYFRAEQLGTFEQRREAIRRKRLAKKPFKLPILHSLASPHGDLIQVKEDFIGKTITFQYTLDTNVNYEVIYKALFTDFEYIRPVHVNKMQLETVRECNPALEISSNYKAYQYPLRITGAFLCGTWPSPSTLGREVTTTMELTRSGYTQSSWPYRLAGKVIAGTEIVPDTLNAHYLGGFEVNQDQTDIIKKYNICGIFLSGNGVI